MVKSNVKGIEVIAENQSERQKESGPLLRDKVAVIFGAGGAIGSQVAREFSRQVTRTSLSITN
jgi:FlaA1/EpsC-like NDP-sugar epimerase